MKHFRDSTSDKTRLNPHAEPSNPTKNSTGKTKTGRHIFDFLRHKKVKAQATPLYFDGLPDELMEMVLLNLPGEFLLKTCTRVCRRWNKIVQHQVFWKRLCLREGLSVSPAILIDDFLVYYFKRPYNRNLLKNGNADNGLMHWRLLTDGNGGGIVTEKMPVNISAPPCSSGHLGYCWATSSGSNSLYQIVDLEDMGCVPEVLDTIRPRIVCEDWFCGCPGTAFSYSFAVLLCTRDRDIVAGWQRDIQQGAAHHDAQWEHRRLVLENYGPGGRLIYFIHSGSMKDFPSAPNYAGYYGAKFGRSSVRIHFPASITAVTPPSTSTRNNGVE